MLCPIGMILYAAVQAAWLKCTYSANGTIGNNSAHIQASRAYQQHVHSCPICKG